MQLSPAYQLGNEYTENNCSKEEGRHTKQIVFFVGSIESK